MKSRLVASLALGGLATAGFAGCGAGERFSPECEAGTVQQGDGCVKPAATAGAAGTGGGSAGAGGAGSGGAGAGSGGAGTGGAGAGSGGAGTGGAGTGGAGAGSGGAGTGGAGAGSGGAGTGGAGSAGTAGVAGAGGDAGTGGAGENPLWKSGTRLRAYVRDLGGVKTFAGVEETIFLDAAKAWRDTSLGIDCRFGRSVDGTTRCLPTRVMLPAYADSACKAPVLLASPCLDEQKYAYTETADECGPKRRAFPVGKKLGTTTLYYAKTGTGCTQQIYGPMTAYEFGTEAPPALFALATEELENGMPLSRRVLLGEDGSRQVAGAWDTTRNTICRREDVGPSEKRCVPFQGRAYMVASSGPGCALFDIATFRPSQCSSTQKALFVSEMSQPSDCDIPKTAFFEIGDEVASTNVWSTEAGACTPGTATSHYYKKGPGFSSTAFPEFTPKELGAGRIRSQVLANAGLTFMSEVGYASDPYIDKDLFVNCLPTTFPSGKTHCVPFTAIHVVLGSQYGGFADPSCTVPVALTSAAGQCGKPAPATEVLVTETTPGQVCPTVAKVAKLGKQLSLYYEKSTGSCLLGSSSIAYEIGDEVSPPPWGEMPLSVE